MRQDFPVPGTVGSDQGNAGHGRVGPRQLIDLRNQFKKKRPIWVLEGQFLG